MPQASTPELFRLNVIPPVSFNYPPPITVTTWRRPNHVAPTVRGRCHAEQLFNQIFNTKSLQSAAELPGLGQITCRIVPTKKKLMG